jgi:hypothetical protein
VTTGQEPGAGGVQIVPVDDRGAVIEMDRPADQRQLALPWRRIGLVGALLVLVAGGYAATRRHHPPEPPPVGIPQPPPITAQSLQPTGDQCTSSDATALQFGATLTNVSGEPLTAEAVTLEVTTPLRGLRLRDEGWGQCAATPVATGPLAVRPGQTIWFHATFDLLTKCPAMDALDFTIVWRADGMSVTTPVVLDHPEAALPDCGQQVGFGGRP